MYRGSSHLDALGTNKAKLKTMKKSNFMESEVEDNFGQGFKPVVYSVMISDQTAHSVEYFDADD